MVNQRNVENIKVAIKANIQTEKEAWFNPLKMRKWWRGPTAVEAMRAARTAGKGGIPKNMVKATAHKNALKEITALQKQVRNRTRAGIGLGIGGALVGGKYVQHRAKTKAKNMAAQLNYNIANMPIGDRLRLSAGLLFKPEQVGAGVSSQIQQLMNTM